MIARALTAFDRFFFERIDARGFGLLRVLWAFTAFAWMLMQCMDVTEFYSDAGVLPSWMMNLMTRIDYKLTLLDWIATPDAVMALYILMLFSLFCMMVGLAPRFFTIASVILLVSFHERNPLPLGGGDTVLRLLGVLLMIAPRIDAFSVKRLERQWAHWKTSGKLLAPPTMSIWPYRLLLWQLIVLYATATWFKLMGTMWGNGTAVAAALHHPTFSRLPKHVIDVMTPFTPVVAFGTLAWQTTWLLLLIPRKIVNKFFPHGMLKRAIIVGGIWFHGSILLLMDAGSFSMAIFSAYAGLLLADDFRALRDCINRQWWQSTGYSPDSAITVLFDGRCAFCQKSIFALQVLDNLRRLSFVNFHNAVARKRCAPHVSLSELNRAMHVVLPDGTTYAGFDAFRQLTRHLPALWPLVPLLYVPGVPPIGRTVYAFIARNRHGMRSARA